MNQGPLLEAFGAAGLEVWLGTAKPKADTIRLITTSSHVHPCASVIQKRFWGRSAPLYVFCTWIGLPRCDCIWITIFGYAIFMSTATISVDVHMELNFQGRD
ncbi:unnamed protein product [Fusarium graminearum]|uniref:Chromosome 3, complete genome n=2 Tax=Gibberella zeae TaxID=5518 RepID=I1S7T6_GIBZE|nr:hypothetical protein FGSG_12911 [Fusarium graminearum PH-1]CAF3466528.1 unnamed protein product [Fusarium graminearum]ESU12442.1 hypothetical protein FGSG_12911 [Fusarium graminearum PH-1]CAF3475066.1 unnamed protein product [Fusarium graminearum]CAF3546596.1 unnamed protein product [Fusarium graminearum]CAG1965332.1 unnamed protein product [Fusarium graminearum]|eukprot:XP_011325018.1 hypothetical protein FGSG_12911 [Fusarium graminearum PH-1]